MIVKNLGENKFYSLVDRTGTEYVEAVHMVMMTAEIGAGPVRFLVQSNLSLGGIVNGIPYLVEKWFEENKLTGYAVSQSIRLSKNKSEAEKIFKELENFSIELYRYYDVKAMVKANKKLNRQVVHIGGVSQDLKFEK